jgi:hypothetical protein
MANSKISALPSAATPLAGTEVFPVVQGGITEQVSVANLTAGRSVSASGLLVDANSATVAVRITQLGAGNALLVEDSANPDSTPFVIDASGNVVVGALTQMSGFGPLQVLGSSALLSAIGQFSTDATPPIFSFNKSRNASVGSAATIVASGDALGQIRFYGADGSQFIRGAAIAAEVDGTPGTSDMPGRLVFSTTADGAASPTARFRLDSSGNTLNVSVGGLGYGTGSGGAVTQGTSRTTGVTLNKTNGAITLFSVAGLATFQSFTVTNSTVAATDVVHVTQKSGTDLYQIFVTATAAGSFQISFATTGGITVEQPVFNFAVIKAVTA